MKQQKRVILPSFAIETDHTQEELTQFSVHPELTTLQEAKWTDQATRLVGGFDSELPCFGESKNSHFEVLICSLVYRCDGT